MTTHLPPASPAPTGAEAACADLRRAMEATAMALRARLATTRGAQAEWQAFIAAATRWAAADSGTPPPLTE